MANLDELLAEEGYRVSFSSEHDVEEVARLGPDLLLLDGRGGTADSGWAFLERLKADPATAGIPVLVLTAASRASEEHGGRLAELDTALMAKPFDLEELLGEVRRRLAGEPA